MSQMIPCPTCKKKIAADAESCPKCGQPITPEIRDAAIKKANEEKKMGRVGCGVFILLSCFLAYYFGSSETAIKTSKLTSTTTQTSAEIAAVRTAIQNSLKPGEKLGPIVIGDLCGGKGAVMNETASYWIYNDKAYTVNGVAMGYSPKALGSPPSIDASAIGGSIAGKDMAVPANFAIYYADFFDKIFDLAQKNTVKDFKRDGVLAMRIMDGKNYKASIEVKESCGQVTEVEAYMRFKEPLGDTDKEALFFAFKYPISVLSPDAKMKDIFTPLRKALVKKEDGTYHSSLDVGKVRYVMYGSGDKKEAMLAITATPIP